MRAHAQASTTVIFITPHMHSQWQALVSDLISNPQPLVTLLDSFDNFFCISFLFFISVFSSLSALVLWRAVIADGRAEKRKQQSCEKAIKRIFSPGLLLCGLSSASPMPLHHHRRRRHHTNKCKWMWKLYTGREQDPCLRAGSEWALKESLINLSTAPIGPLGIFFSLPLSEWEGRDGGGGRK